MKLFNSALSLRTNDHVATRLVLREERMNFRLLFTWISPLYITFALVDWVSVPGSSLWYFVAMRTGVVFIARALYVLTRGRLSPWLRTVSTIAFYVAAIEFLMIRYDLVTTAYFAGVSLIMLTAVNVFPMPAPNSFFVYIGCTLPLLIFIPVSSQLTATQTLNAWLMMLGTGLLSAFASNTAFSELSERIRLSEVLTRDLGKREKEIRTKAAALLKRQTFESQFSPQIVAAVLDQGSSAIEMRQQKVCVIVIDVENSTTKAKSLEPKAYKEVIEEVFDVFSSACLKWNVTVDKFTGDGAQAFAGAPVSSADDIDRALMAGRDTLRMLEVRSFSLRKKWRDPLRIRAAVCEGPALVGFLGRGTLKSFTAIGETVSFAHRLCSAGEPGAIMAYSLSSTRSIEARDFAFTRESKTVRNLKGFGEREFQVSLLKPVQVGGDILVDNGRCELCGTPLVLEEDSGIPKLSCPGCQTRAKEAA